MCAYMCVCIYAYICVCIYIYIYIHTHIYESESRSAMYDSLHHSLGQNTGVGSLSLVQGTFPTLLSWKRLASR